MDRSISVIAGLTMIVGFGCADSVSMTADDSCLQAVTIEMGDARMAVGDTMHITARVPACARHVYRKEFGWQIDGPRLVALTQRTDTTAHVLALEIGTTWITAIGAIGSDAPHPLVTLPLTVQ